MAVPLTELQAARDTLVRAIASNTLRSRGPDGREIQYRSVEEMKSALTVLDNEIARASGGTGSRISFAQHRRGDGTWGGSNRSGCF